MRTLLLLLGSFLAASIAISAAERPESPAVPFTIVGTLRDGIFDGPAELFTSASTRRASGAYRNGKADGSWTFWDSRGSRIAVFTFQEDVLEGPAKLYFGSFGAPDAAGRLKVGGSMKAGGWDGDVPSWYSDGSTRTKRVYEGGKIVRASAHDRDGSSYPDSAAMEQAHLDDASDRELISMLSSIIREAPDHAQRRKP